MSESRVNTHPEANDYLRQLDDVQLIALGVDVQRRITAMIGQGVPLPLDQMTAHHLLGLLEALAGPDRALSVREWHLTWLDRQLDAAEAAMRMRLLESGIFDGNGAGDDDLPEPGFP